MGWQEIRTQGQGALAVRASKKLRTEDLLVTQLGGVMLRLQLDRIPLWRGNHVSVKQLAEDFAQYLYLPRLQNEQVMIEAVKDGLQLVTRQDDSFAYAEAYDAESGRYRGLRVQQSAPVALDGQCVLVKPDVAQKQLKTETSHHSQTGVTQTTGGGADVQGDDTGNGETAESGPCRFHGTVQLDTTRPGRDASKIAEEVIGHLSGLLGSEVEVTLEVQAKVPEGVPEYVVRTVTENCRTLKFRSYEFKAE